MSKMNNTLSNLSEKGFKMIRKSLLIDYAFMPFLYLLMSAISCLILRHSATFSAGWKHVLYFMCWLPFITWLLDVLENAFTLSVLSDYRNEEAKIKKSQFLMMSISSVLKWITGLGWLLFMISLLLCFLVDRFM